VINSLFCLCRSGIYFCDLFTNHSQAASESSLTQNGAQPQYVFVDNDGKIIKNAGGYVADIKRFINILDEVKAAYKP
jgi:thioredoxin-related protein